MENPIGKPGRLVELRKGDILVPEYQREADWSRIKRYAREFDWYLFGTLYISYRAPDYYVVDGRHRLEAARLRPDLDMLPALAFDFQGPQHEAEVFVMLQRSRKPLVTKDMHGAELLAGGEFGAVAKRAEDFLTGLECESIPLASIRRLVKAKPAAFARIAPLVAPLVGPAPLAKDFIEGLVYLEDMLGPDDSLATKHRRQLEDTGYQRLVAAMIQYGAQHSDGRLAKIASPRIKAEALRWALFDEGVILEPVYHNGEAIGARVGISRTDVAAG